MTEVARSQWYIANDAGERAGPFSTDQIITMRLKRRIDDTTPCWQEGMSEWLRLDQVVSLTALINSGRRRARRRMWTIAALVVVAVVAGGFVLKKVIVAKAVARAEKMVAERQYFEAGQSLRPYLEKNEYKDPRALTLMGVAALGHYATGESSGGATNPGFFSSASQQQAKSVDYARKMFQRAFEGGSKWKDQAAQYVNNIVGEIPEDAPDLCDRCAQISALLAELQLADAAELAKQALARYRSALGGVSQAGCSQQFAETVLLGDSSLDGEFISAVYRFRRETPAGQRLGSPGNMFVAWAEQNPKLAFLLCTGLTTHARTANDSRNYGECDDALAAACRIDDKTAAQAHKLWLASLDTQIKSRAASAEACRQVVQRLNDLAARPGMDVQAVGHLYLGHRTEFIASDPQVESRLNYQLRGAVAALGDEHFLHSGEQLLEAGNYAAAVADLSRVRQGSPQYDSAATLLHKAQYQLHLQTGQKSLEEHDYMTAERAFRQALALEPKDKTAAAGLEKCAQSANQRVVEAGIERARGVCQTGRLEEARSILDALLQAHPGHAAVVAELRNVNQKSVSANCDQATSLIAEKRFVAAQTLVARALELRPADSQAIALNEQVKQHMANPDTTDLTGLWTAPGGIRLVLAQDENRVSVSVEKLAGNYTMWKGTWTRDGTTLDGTFQVAVHGMPEPALIDVRAEIQDSKTISVSWKETSWRNQQKTRGRGYGTIDWVRTTERETPEAKREPGYGYGMPGGAASPVRRPRMKDDYEGHMSED